MVVVLVQNLGAVGFGAKSWCLWFWCKILVLVVLVQNLGACGFGGGAIETDGDLRALSLSTPICRQPARQKRGNTTCA